MQSDEEPTQQYRYVTVMDVMPGRAFPDSWEPGMEQPKDGAKTVIITLGFDGEVEQPMMIGLDDASRLTIDLLTCLSHHGNPVAETILNEYFGVSGEALDDREGGAFDEFESFNEFETEGEE